MTLTGGEPFDQAAGLVALVKEIRTRFTGDILIYTGYPIESVAVHVEAFAGLVDAVISDPYEVEAAQTLALRGSDNQRLHLLTELGHERFSQYERSRCADDDRLDLMLDAAGSAWMAGIPRKGDMDRLLSAIRATGATAFTTQARRALRK